MKLNCFAYLFCILVFYNCKKENTKTSDDPPIIQKIDSLLLNCEKLPATPQPFGWQDSTINENKNINAFFYNPLNNFEIIYQVNGDIFGYNKVFLYNTNTKQNLFLFNNGNYQAQINNKGWIVFNSNDNNIYKIKANGDSLKQLTFNNISNDPKWDYTNTTIYFFKKATLSSPSQLTQINTKGQELNSVPIEYTNSAFAKKTSKLFYLKNFSNRVTVFLKDMATNSETLIISSNKQSNIQQNDFFNLSIDNTDENMYWTNFDGIYKYNLSNSKIDTLYKNCENSLFINPILSIKNNKMTFVHKKIKVINNNILFYTYKSYQLDLMTKEIERIEIYP
jgi:hypothetical protein